MYDELGQGRTSSRIVGSIANLRQPQQNALSYLLLLQREGRKYRFSSLGKGSPYSAALPIAAERKPSVASTLPDLQQCVLEKTKSARLGANQIGRASCRDRV